jgi:hypothetical protein
MRVFGRRLLATALLVGSATGGAAFASTPEQAGETTRPDATLAAMSEPTGDPIENGTPVRAEIGSPTEEDVYLFEGEAGDSVRIEATAGDRRLDAVVELYGPSRTWLGTVDDTDGYDPGLSAVLRSDGIHQVVVRSAGGGSTGPYQLLLERHAMRLLNVPGGPVEGTLERGGVDSFAINGRTGDPVGLLFGSIDFPVDVTFVGPDGTTTVPGSFFIEGADFRGIELAATGRHRIEIRDGGGWGGNYVVEVVSTAEAELVPGSAVSTSISELGTIARFMLRGERSEPMELQVRGGLARATVDIVTEDGALVASAELLDDDGDGTSTTILRTELPTSAAYHVEVRPDDRSRGWVEVVLVSGDSSLLRPDETAYGTIGAEGRQTYRFEARSGDYIQLSMRSESIDSFIELWGPDGSQLSTDDDGGGNRDSYIDWSAEIDGTYTVVARPWGESEQGDFELTLFLD